MHPEMDDRRPNEDQTTEALRRALTGDYKPLAHFGVAIQIPWWRRRIQRYLAPRRFQRWAQRQILATMKQET